MSSNCFFFTRPFICTAERRRHLCTRMILTSWMHRLVLVQVFKKCTEIYYESTRAHKRYPYCCPSLCFAKSKSSWARAHFIWAALKLVNGTITPSLWPTINVLRGGEQSRDGAFLQIQPFSFQTHFLSHHWFLVVAVTGKVKAAKSGRGGRPCPVRTMYTYSFRPFAGEWCVCGKLVQRYSIVWRTYVSTLRLCSDTAWLFLIDLTASSDIVQWNLSTMVTV